MLLDLNFSDFMLGNFIDSLVFFIMLVNTFENV